MLIKHGANVNKQLSAGKDKLTPLMLAAAYGHLDIARRLVQAGATVELLGIQTVKKISVFLTLEFEVGAFMIDLCVWQDDIE